MTLAADAFIRRFLIHVLPSGFHRIRHYGLFSSGIRTASVARIRDLLGSVQLAGGDCQQATAADPSPPSDPLCPCCGGRMVVIEVFGRVMRSRSRTGSAFRVDTS